VSGSESQAPAAPRAEVFIFPLNTVLFPGGVLPLKVFEQRYIEMTKVCLSESRDFGVCLIKEGREVGAPAVPQEIGCLARITQWDMPQLGVFQLITEGIRRFRIVRSTVAKNGLISAAIETLPADPQVAPADKLCGDVLKAIIDKLGAAHFPTPHRFDDAAWVGYRLSEVLPLALETRQELLQFADPQDRLARLSRILSEQGVGPERM
jgi:Lon protease-like protein